MTPDTDVLVGRREMSDWTITVRYTKALRIALWLGLWFICLGVRIMGCRVEVEEESDGA